MGFHFHRMARQKEEKAQDSGAVLKRLVAYISPFRWQLILILLLVACSALMRVAGPYLIGRAVDRFMVAGDRAGLGRIMILLLGTYILGWAANASQTYMTTVVGQRILAHMRTQIFDQVQRLSLKYLDQQDAGDLMSRLVNDVDTLGQLLNAGMVRLLGDLLTLIGIIIAMLDLSSPLALVSFSMLPIMSLATSVFSRRARTAFRRTREKIGEVSAELEENISGVRVVQAFSRERANQARFDEVNAANRDANVQAVGITSAFSPTMDVLSTIALALIAGYGGYLALNHQVSLGTIVAFLAYARRFYQPILSLATLYTQFQSALAASERIFGLLDTTPDLVDDPDAIEMPRIEGRIVFDHVYFHYKPDEPVLKNVNIVIEPGQTAALVGPTGAGKTTMASLIGRFYDVAEGAVRIDGHDVRHVQRASLRRQMGVVLQDAFLFSGTVMDNIRYGRLEATDEEVMAAAEMVNADGFIERLPNGYDTEVQERGSNFSQGQRQLIAFARAVLADPRILILDEATSSVDTRTEMLIQEALGRLLKGRTSVVIAHRLSTIRNADQVFVIQEGEIVERGTHDSLLAAKGPYYNLYMSQFRREAQPQEAQLASSPAQVV